MWPGSSVLWVLMLYTVFQCLRIWCSVFFFFFFLACFQQEINFHCNSWQNKIFQRFLQVLCLSVTLRPQNISPIHNPNQSTELRYFMQSDRPTDRQTDRQKKTKSRPWCFGRKGAISKPGFQPLPCHYLGQCFQKFNILIPHFLTSETASCPHIRTVE